jgi:hypothetical protein
VAPGHELLAFRNRNVGDKERFLLIKHGRTPNPAAVVPGIFPYFPPSWLHSSSSYGNSQDTEPSPTEIASEEEEEALLLLPTPSTSPQPPNLPNYEGDTTFLRGKKEVKLDPFF